MANEKSSLKLHPKNCEPVSLQFTNLFFFFSTTKFAWGFIQSLKEVAKIVAGEEPMVTAASAGAFKPLL